MAKKFEKKWLEGLTYSGSKEAPRDKKTDRKKVFKPFTRPLTEADVLSFSDLGDVVVITTTDGKKYKVKKDGKTSSAPASSGPAEGAGDDGKTE